MENSLKQQNLKDRHRSDKSNIDNAPDKEKVDNDENPRFEEECRLPEEILEGIFRLLESPSDHFNVSKACRQFERILKPSKINWLFCQVLPIIYPYLHKYEILDCRIVSKMWKQAVDNLLENHSSIRPFDPVLDTSTNPLSRQYFPNLEQKGFAPLTLTPFEFGNNLSPGKILEKMRCRQGIVFAIKHITSICADYRLYIQFWVDFFELLQKIGQHVWSLELQFEDGRKDYLSFYKILRRCLQLTPNLKKLHLGYQEHLFVPYQRQRYFPDFRIRQLIMKKPLPKLLQLSSVFVTNRVFGTSTTKLLIVDEVFRRYGQQVKMIQMYANIDDEKRLRMHFWNTNHLTEMHLISDFGLTSSAPNTLSTVEMLLSSTPNCSSLAKLTIDFHHTFPNENVHGVMHVLLKYPALRHLKLEFLCYGSSKLFPAQEGTFVELESVKSLDILVHEKGFSYDTILSYLPNLEYLVINDKMRDAESVEKVLHGELVERDEKFEVLKGLATGKLYLSSAIWKKLKFLKMITYYRYAKGVCDINNWQLSHANNNGKAFTVTRTHYEVLKNENQ